MLAVATHIGGGIKVHERPNTRNQDIKTVLSGSSNRPHSPPANQGPPRNSKRWPGERPFSMAQAAAIRNERATSDVQRMPGTRDGLSGVAVNGSAEEEHNGCSEQRQRGHQPQIG